jgi:hypothetical protein
MKAYVITTGVIFGMITVAHLLRFVMEGSHLAGEPFFILLTLLSAGLCVWSWLVLRRLSQ